MLTSHVYMRNSVRLWTLRQVLGCVLWALRQVLGCVLWALRQVLGCVLWALSQVLSLLFRHSFSLISPSRSLEISDWSCPLYPLSNRFHHLVPINCFVASFRLYIFEPQVRVEGPRSARETAVGLLCRIFLAHGQSGVCGSALGSEFNSEESIAMTPVSLNKVRRSVRLMLCPPPPPSHSLLLMFVLASSDHNLHL
jgi:hypothetical protein